MDPNRAAVIYPVSQQTPSAPDSAPTVADWLKEMREMRKEARDERKEQTKAFVEALDGLGTKLDNSTNAVRDEMKRHLTVLSLVFIGSFVVLAGLAGASIYLKFGPVQGGTTPPPAETSDAGTNDEPAGEPAASTYPVP